MYHGNETLSKISEATVLAGIFHHSDCYLEIQHLVEEETFSSDLHKVIFKCLQKGMEYPSLDFSSFLGAATELKLLEYIEPKLDKIKDVFSEKPDINNVPEHAKIIRRLQFARDLKSKLRDSAKELDEISGAESLDTILSIVESPVQDLSLSYIRQEDHSAKQFSEGLDEFLANLDEVRSVGISSGYPGYDYAIGGGFRPRCLDLISARLKQGKSYLALNFAINVAKQGYPVMYLDTEMSIEDHWSRSLANLSSVNVTDIAEGRFRLDKHIEKLVLEGCEKLKKLPISYYNVVDKKFNEILPAIKRWVLKTVGFNGDRTNKCLVVYDYFQVTDPSALNDSMREYQALGFQIKELHNFVSKMDIPCVAFVQSNRQGIDRESTDVIADSDRLGRTATSVSLFKTKTDEERAEDGLNNGNKKLITLAARFGPDLQDDGYLCMNMDGSLGRIDERGFIRRINRDTIQQGDSVDF